MKTLKWVFPGIIAAAFAVNCSTRVSEPVKQKAFEPRNASVETGEGVYMRHCQKCHPAGEGGLGPAINAAPYFIKRFQVRHGLGVMPAFSEEVISKEDLRDLSAYLKAWKKY